MSDIVKRLRLGEFVKAEEAAAEVERLRGLLADVQIILNSHNNIVGNLNGEITRLRELLREAHLALSFMPAPTRKLLDLRYRVREALGE